LVVSIILSKFKDIILSSQQTMTAENFFTLAYPRQFNTSQALSHQKPKLSRNWRYFYSKRIELALVKELVEAAFQVSWN